MKRSITLLLGTLLIFTQAYAAPTPPATSSHVVPSMANMIKDILPAVVNLTIRGDVPVLPGQKQGPTQGKTPPNRTFEAVGSGVIVDAKNGYIVTNAHVIRYGKVIIVTLNDGRMLKAKPIGIDVATDIAVIQVNDKYLQDIKLADSANLQPGDFVAAIGNPFGQLHQTVTSGVVSALNRSIGVEGPGGYENFIQTDASINPGNSGGALVDLNGNLVGINTAIVGRGNIGIGFAIPSNMVKTVMEQLIKFGKVKRGVLGVMVQTLTPDLADAFNIPNTVGALVTHLQDNSPAGKAGLKEKDVILSINDTPVKTAAQLRSIIGLMSMGTKAKLLVRRGKQDMTLTATIESLDKLMKEKEKDNKKHLLSGMRLNNLNQLDANHKQIKGVLVLEVKDTSDAWLAGLRAGDVILSANDKNVDHISDLTKLADQHPKQLLLTINRAGATLYMVIS